MGNKNTSNVNVKLYNPEEYEVLGEMNTERYGKSTILLNKQNQKKYIESSKTTNDEKQFNKQIEQLQFLKTLDHPNLLKLLNFNSNKHNEFCSSFYKIGLLYEYLSNDLKTELTERKLAKIPYCEGEVFYLLVSLVKALLYLKQFQVSHEEIKPSNILIDEEGKLKLAQSNQNILSDEYYMSQEKFSCLKTTQAYNKEKNDIFAIGMIVLEAGLLEDVSSLYDLTNLSINFAELNKKIAKFQYHYSYQLYDVLSKMLKEKESERISLDQLALDIDSLSKFSFDRIFTIEVVKSQENVTEQKNVVVEEKKENISYNIYPTTQTVSNDDLMARVEAALKKSQQTIDQYGVKESNQTTTTYYTTTYVSNPQQVGVTGYTPVNVSTQPIQTRAY